MRNIPKANIPAIYKPVKSGVFKGEKKGEMWIIKQSGGTPYSHNGLIMRSSLSEPIYGYVKNYTKYKKDFSLFLWTPESDAEKVETYLDKIKLKVKREDAIEVLNNITTYKYVDSHLV